jgi:hypothetical protein
MSQRRLSLFHMANSPNSKLPVASTSALGSRISQLRVALIASFLASCVFCFFLFTSAAVQHDRASNARASAPAWVFPLGTVFFLAPYILSWILLSTRQPETIAGGAGVACAFFGASLLASPNLIMAMFLIVGMSAWNSAPDPGLMAAGLTLLVFLAISLWIVWSAFRIGKTQWNAFGVAIGATAFYLFFGFQSLTLTVFRGQRHGEQKRVQSEMEMYKPAMLARQKVIALTACLLRNHMLHPEAGYPAAIDPLPAGYRCDSQPSYRPDPRIHFYLHAPNRPSHRSGH